ncbi:MAG: cysteine desulfurase [Alphaproteobacteria bacterium]|nr:cysteine desulfurase [Alphaproteobacteria bacterium]
MNPVYLDYNATTPIRPEVLELVTNVMAQVGNASSVHAFGQKARDIVETARAQVAGLCGVAPEQVVFTSGATESNNTVLCGLKNKRVLVSAIEHPAVLAAAPHAEKIPVTSDGVVDLDVYRKMLGEGDPPAIVSVMLVNSETGVIQPVREMADMAHEAGALFHTDAVQGAGRLDISFDTLGVDYMSLSAHKMAGPQGVGAIIWREGLELSKFMLGGGQEKNCRAGTHNTAGIAGMGLAAQMAKDNMPAYQKIGELRDYLEGEIRKISNEAVIYGENAPRVPNTTNVGLPGVPAQTQMMALDLGGVAVSSGSACSSGSFKSSHVLLAMDVDEEAAKCALRISMGWATTKADIDRFLNVWSEFIKRQK